MLEAGGEAGGSGVLENGGGVMTELAMLITRLGACNTQPPEMVY